MIVLRLTLVDVDRNETIAGSEHVLDEVAETIARIPPHRLAGIVMGRALQRALAELLADALWTPAGWRSEVER